MKIRFMSGNAHKISEVQRILAPVGVDIVPVSRKIEELQTEDVESLVRDKLTKAFEGKHPAVPPTIRQRDGAS